MGDLSNKKKHKPTDTLHVPHSNSTSSLIPGLLDEISLAILARVPRIYYLNLKAVSRSWKVAITSPEIYKVRKELGTTEEWLFILTSNQHLQFFWHALDPVSKKWQKLPPIPYEYAEEVYRRNEISNMVDLSTIRIDNTDTSYFGCAAGAVDGCLYMLGGFSTGSASTMARVWKYDPVSNSWSRVNSMSVGRALFKTGVLNNKLFVVGGIRVEPDDYAPISAEVYDPQTGLWSDLPSISFSKAYALQTANSTDLRQPFAIELISYRGKLYALQGLYSLPDDDADVGGEVYDPETNSWVDMPTGMIKGWPVAGEQVCVNVDGDLYALDHIPYSSSAKIYLYDHVGDSWNVVYEEVPDPNLSGSVTCPLAAGLLGKLHVIKKDNRDIVVMQADIQNDLITSSAENIWTVIASISSDYASDNLVSCQTLDI